MAGSVHTLEASSASPAPAELPGLAYRGYVLFVLILVSALSNLDKNIMSMLVEPIRAEFNLSDGQIGLLTGLAFALTYALVCVPAARFADRGSRRNIIAGALAFWSAMTALCGVAQNYFQLFLARVGVGAGEAGAAAPMQALLADIFPPRQRATAMALFLLGPPIGVALGFRFGGWALDQGLSWRTIFMLAGLPALIVVPMLLFTVRNIRKGLADGARQQDAQPLMTTLKTLWSIKTLVWLIAGATIQALVGMGLSSWMPAFLERSHDVSRSVIGAQLGSAMGLGSLIGHLLGGPLSDYLARRHPRAPMWIGVVTAFSAAGLSAVAFYGPVEYFFVLIGLQVMMSGMFSAPLLAIVPTLAPVWARATAAACLLVSINIVGLGLGPAAVGALSDLLRPAFGEESLRLAMLGALLVAIPAAICFYMASRHYNADLAASQARLRSDSAPAAGVSAAPPSSVAETKPAV